MIEECYRSISFLEHKQKDTKSCRKVSLISFSYLFCLLQQLRFVFCSLGSVTSGSLIHTSKPFQIKGKQNLLSLIQLCRIPERKYLFKIVTLFFNVFKVIIEIPRFVIFYHMTQENKNLFVFSFFHCIFKGQPT